MNTFNRDIHREMYQSLVGGVGTTDRDQGS